MNRIKMSDDFDEFFIRDCVRDEFNTKSKKMIQSVLSNGWNYADCNSSPFYDFCSYQSQLFENEVTENEFQYILYNVQIGCGLEELNKEGRIQKLGDTYYADNSDSSS